MGAAARDRLDTPTVPTTSITSNTSPLVRHRCVAMQQPAEATNSNVAVPGSGTNGITSAPAPGCAARYAELKIRKSNSSTTLSLLKSPAWYFSADDNPVVFA